MKVKELLNDLMAEKEVSEEKDNDGGGVLSYEGKREFPSFKAPFLFIIIQ